jgi:hypothetical protein
MIVADITETCRNMDWLCENFRNTKFMVHTANLQKNTALRYFKTIMSLFGSVQHFCGTVG